MQYSVPFIQTNLGKITFWARDANSRDRDETLVRLETKTTSLETGRRLRHSCSPSRYTALLLLRTLLNSFPWTPLYNEQKQLYTLYYDIFTSTVRQLRTTVHSFTVKCNLKSHNTR